MREARAMFYPSTLVVPPDSCESLDSRKSDGFSAREEVSRDSHNVSNGKRSRHRNFTTFSMHSMHSERDELAFAYFRTNNTEVTLDFLTLSQSLINNMLRVRTNTTAIPTKVRSGIIN